MLASSCHAPSTSVGPALLPTVPDTFRPHNGPAVQLLSLSPLHG